MRLIERQPSHRPQLATHLEVEPVALLDNALYLEPFQPDETGKVVLHPLFLLAPRSVTTQSLKGTADVSLLAPQPRPFSKTPILNRRYGSTRNRP